ncbi:hypothetical protein AC249_AIPGENE14725 [Exaiptasia diaphana]|nr:hypothetical protein AC249_AIPGENE14725 [Exaiptasia diaphana]
MSGHAIFVALPNFNVISTQLSLAMAQSSINQTELHRGSVTIEEIMNEHPNHTISSPRKLGQTKLLKCAVLTKSDQTQTKYGDTMFTMTLCDFNTMFSMKSICFAKEMFEKFECGKTYDLVSFAIKKGLGINPEILITENTQVAISSFQYTVERKWFKISQISRNETHNIAFVNLKAQVAEVGEIETVGAYPNNHEKREITLQDDSGIIILVLWRERAKTWSLNKGQTISIENARNSKFRDVRQLTTVGETIISTIEDDFGELPAVLVTSPNKRSHQCITNVATKINAMKEFKTTMKCINCRKVIEWNDLSQTKAITNNMVVTCEICTTKFKASASKLFSECQLLLDCNNLWFVAKSSILPHLFDQEQPIIAAPSDELIEQVLENKYEMTLDMATKIIEHLAVIHPGSPNEEQPETLAKKSRPQNQEETI